MSDHDITADARRFRFLTSFCQLDGKEEKEAAIEKIMAAFPSFASEDRPPTPQELRAMVDRMIEILNWEG